MKNKVDDKIKKRMLSSFFKTDKAQLNRCLYLSMNCDNAAIQAHSVQNSRTLDILCENGHITTFQRRIDKEKGPQIKLGLVGRNKALTFTGLCSTHDQELFSIIDNEEICLENKQHLFLLAYRSVHKELHATMAAAKKIQSAYLQRVDLGLDPVEQPSQAGMIAVNRMMISYETWLYKTDFDDIFLNKDYALLSHDTVVIKHARPTIAVSALFSMDENIIKDDVLRVVLNIIPVSNKHSFIIFSYRNKEKSIARLALNRILNSNGMHQLYEVSRLILNNCENFVLSPSYVESWEPSKKETIINYFTRTILKGDMEFHSPNLYLF